MKGSFLLILSCVCCFMSLSHAQGIRPISFPAILAVLRYQVWLNYFVFNWFFNHVTLYRIHHAQLKERLLELVLPIEVCLDHVIRVTSHSFSLLDCHSRGGIPDGTVSVINQLIFSFNLNSSSLLSVWIRIC
jgi:hypothetical protein